MTEFASFTENPVLGKEGKEKERRERIEGLHRELREAQVGLDRSVVALGDFSLLGKIARRREYRETLAALREAIKRVRRIRDALENEVVAGKEVSEQLGFSCPENVKSGRPEPWKRNIPPRNGQ